MIQSIYKIHFFHFVSTNWKCVDLFKYSNWYLWRVAIEKYENIVISREGSMSILNFVECFIGFCFASPFVVRWTEACIIDNIAQCVRTCYESYTYYNTPVPFCCLITARGCVFATHNYYLSFVRFFYEIFVLHQNVSP